MSDNFYSTKKITDVWANAAAFKTDYKASALYDAKTVGGVTNYHNSLNDDNIDLLYYLLYAKYGNTPIANQDQNQFKYKLFSIIFQYGPTWQKDLDIQDKLRNLSEDDIIAGAKTIYNHAFNDATDPSTSTLEEIQYINDQNTSNFKKSKMGAYSELVLLLHRNVTNDFIRQFKVCFRTMLGWSPFPVYVEEEEN